MRATVSSLLVAWFTKPVTHLGSPRMHVRRVDGARLKVDHEHADALPLKGGKLIDREARNAETVGASGEIGPAGRICEVCGFQCRD